ncbi:MAG TPA: hypothetical protein VFV89_07195 [Nocardioides sp.]|nr:hypothetical protein [Nocardioides sp.]
MVLLDTAGAVAALPSLGISEELAGDLKKFLTSSAGELQDSTPEQTGSHAFGTSPASLQCASDAAKARTHVAKAITDMAAGLVGYEQVVTDLYKNVHEVDDVAQADLVKKAAQANACVAPSFASPSACTLPGSSTEDR